MKLEMRGSLSVVANSLIVTQIRDSWRILLCWGISMGKYRGNHFICCLERGYANP